MCPPFSLYFAALFRRLTTICSSRVGSASTQRFPRSIETSSVCFRSSMSGLTVADGAVEDRGRVEHVPPELDLPAGDAGDVQQVVDEPRQVLHLPRDDLHRPVDVLPVRRLWPTVDGVADGRERVPQLVGEHGEELVLPLVVGPRAPRRASRSRWRWRRVGDSWTRMASSSSVNSPSSLSASWMQSHVLTVAADERGGEPSVFSRDHQGHLLERLPPRVVAQIALGQADGLDLRVDDLIERRPVECGRRPAAGLGSR